MLAKSTVHHLELCFTQDHALVAAAQELRYQVFYEEMGAVAGPATRASRLDVDAFDAIADHLLVLDTGRSAKGGPFVAGCYRLLRGTVAAAHGGFYSASEFDLGVFADRVDRVVELGRSCVHPHYRNGTVMQLLWRGIAHYLERHGLDVMLGCASLPGTDLDALAPSLAYLGARHLAPVELRTRPVSGRNVKLPAADRFTAIELERGKRALPPLLKAYLRMGGSIGDGAVVDPAFNTVDVCLVLPTERLKDRYLRHLAMPPSGRAVAA
jgi:L-ornithine Nalpha-acyltransferase